MGRKSVKTAARYEHVDRRLVSDRELAERWGCERSTVARTLDKAGLPVYCLGGIKRYAKDDVEAFMKEHFIKSRTRNRVPMN